MPNELLDIVVLSLFVVIFGSIYFKRASGRLRSWVGGWLLILLHFFAKSVHPVTPFFQNLDQSVSICTLLLSGVCFLLSASTIAENRWRGALVTTLIGIPALFYVNFLLYGGESLFPLYVAAFASAIGGGALAWSFYPARGRLVATIAGIFVCGEAWTFYAIAHHRPEDGISALLTEIFLTFAALYWSDFQRLSAGVLTTVCGLVAWAAVFPVALLCEYLIPAVAIPDGLWNVPKYFVAFGMILTLLEDEILATSKAGEHYRLLFVANPHPMWIHDPQTLRFLRVNDAAVAQYGYSHEEFLQMTVHDLRPGEDFESVLQETARSDSFTLAGPWCHRRKDGSEIQVDIAAHAIELDGRSCRFVQVQDVTERQRLYDQLVHQAHHDSLTGLPNRLLLEDRMRQTLAYAARHGRRAAVICVDLDRFKRINDTFGHAAGDHCLQQVAARISARVRSVDTVARIGGEEFMVVLGEIGGTHDAEIVGKDLLECVLEPIECGGQTFQVSASLGIAVYPDDGTDSSELWYAADSAMYRAKHGGGGKFLFVSPDADGPANEKRDLEISMRRMLKEGGFALQYQPVYSTTGKLCSLEAQLALDHPRLGRITGDRLVPIAEECGLIVAVGEWALEELCRQSSEWQREGLTPIRIALSVSPLQFMRSDYSACVRRVLAQYAFDPLLLEIGINEATTVSTLPEVSRQMRSLASMGIHFSVENFGSGYSSLSQLHQMPVSTLKMDRFLVERISAVNGTHALVRAVIALGHSLGLQVSASGVDRGDQLEALRRLGCDFLQGSQFADPMPASRVPRHLNPALPPASQGADLRKKASSGSAARL